MKVAVYTSCSVNYLPKARVLARTLKHFHPDSVIVLLLCDEIPSFIDISEEPFDHVWQPQDLGYSTAWIFQHNVMELCTAVKGRGLVKLLDVAADADLVLYLDPDVVVYHPLDLVLDYIGENEIGLVPHITAPEKFETGITLTELSVVRHGTYNLGHLIIRPGQTSRQMAQWWADRLDRYCFDDPERGLFTDQRWCDLVPAIFDKVAILRQPNLDVASWNAGSRELVSVGGEQEAYLIDGVPLLTYHFSGTGPSGTHRRVRMALNPGNGAQAEIERNYEAAIARCGQAVLENWPFFGDSFDDGTAVTASARLFYRRHDDLVRAFPNPFAVTDNCYLSWLRGNYPEAARGVAIKSENLSKAFQDVFDEAYYLNRYPDVAHDIASGKFDSALEHYIMIGSDRLYDPNHYFVSLYYAERARELGGFSPVPGSVASTLLWHYLTVGLPSGVEPIPYFDSYFYLTKDPGLLESFRVGWFSSPLAHFIHFGDSELRAPGPKFDPANYLKAEPRAKPLIDTKSLSGPFGAFIGLGGVPGRIEARFGAVALQVG